MRMMAPALLVLVLAGCASRVSMAPVDYSMTDRPKAARVDLSWRNDSGKTVCMSKQDWPENGGLHESADRVFLMVDNEKFPIEDFNQGLCIAKYGDCDYRLAPGANITGFIEYRSFRLPERLHDRPKTLEFKAIAFYCK